MKFFRQYFEQETIRSIRNSYHMIDSVILELIIFEHYNIAFYIRHLMSYLDNKKRFLLKIQLSPLNGNRAIIKKFTLF